VVAHIVALTRPAMMGAYMGAKGWTGAVAALTAMALLSGCGRNCQNSCARIYEDCQIAVGGVSVAESMADCSQECEDALQQTGNMNGYDPRGRDLAGDAFELQNDIQAAAWMDCIWDSTCEEIDPRTGGLCWPI
jgi:hypothetical protein